MDLPIRSDYFRRRIIENSDNIKVKVIDLALPLREQFQNNQDRLFYPNEGHLTPEGHRVVADILLNIA